MPAYIPTPPPPYSIGPGEFVQVWLNETPVAGVSNPAASQQVALVRVPGDFLTAFAVDAQFSAAPGVFEVDVQAANEDIDSHYQTVSGGNITTVDATNNTFHFSANAENARFVRLLMRSRTNAVSISATIKR